MKSSRIRLIGILCAAMVFLAACDQADVPTTALTDDFEEAYLPKAGDPIPGQYIVVLKDRSEFAGKSVRAVLDEMTTAEGVETIFQYETALLGFAGKFSDAAIDRIRQNPYVDYVEQDRVVTLPKPISGFGLCEKNPNHSKCQEQAPEPDPEPSTEVTPWGISRVEGGLVYIGGKVAWVIDTGIDLDHPDLNVDVDRSVSFLTGKEKNNPDDQNGHGTHVAGTIAAKYGGGYVVGVAAGATVVSVRVLDRRGSGTISGVIAGVNHVAVYGKKGDVANMSLGGGVSDALDDAVVNASGTELEPGVMFALAAGNSSNDAINYSPARAVGDNIATVAAFAQGDVWASFSNYGQPPVDYIAPGVAILSLWKNGGTNTISGTSMAAPHVAGLLLLGDIKNGGIVMRTTDDDYIIAIHLRDD